MINYEEGNYRDQIRISAKDLGNLGKLDFCPRCFWLKLRIKKLPFGIFPGIFSSIDAYTKKVIHGYFDKNKKAPNYLEPLGHLVAYIPPPPYTKFQTVCRSTNILLTGVADGIFVKSDGHYVIADFKTAKFTDKQDELHGMYDIQLNAYARIALDNAKNWGWQGSVTDLALVYMEPVTEVQGGEEQLNKTTGFDLGFSAHHVKVDLDLSKINHCLLKVREIYQNETPPEPFKNCQDCSSLNQIMELLRSPSLEILQMS